MDQSGMVKIVFLLGSEHPTGIERERVWATPLPDGTYRIENSPFHAYGVSYADIVFADLDSGDLVFTNIARRGGHSTYRLRLPRGKGHSYFMEFWPQLERLGCTYERTGDERHIYSLDLSPGVAVHDVYSVLTALEQAGVCEFEEGHYFDSSPRH